MTHKMIFGLLLVVLSVGEYGCSLVDINATTFAELPPLFGLDDWAGCQGEDDVWCIVDAALVSDEPSAVLTLLQDYSQQSQKHYNRTQVHRGLCVSRCGSEEDGPRPWRTAAERCLNQELNRYGLQASVESVSWCTRPQHSPGSGARALAAVSVVLVALVLLATALHVLGERCAQTDGNKYLLAFSLKKNWEILTYDRTKPRSDQRMKDLSAIEGIKVLGIQGVIFSHVLLVHVYSYSDNPHYVEKMYDQFGWQAVLNSPVWLQAFFSMSAFLTTYSVLITVDKSPITLVKCIMSVINRYIRLTPAAGVALWFTMTWYPLLGSGPLWGWLVVREAEDCSERWWYHLVYAQNHLPTGKFCMGHTWYLAADLQLHAIGLLVLLVVVRWRKAVAPVLALLLLGSALTAGLVSYFYNITPIITGQAPESLRTWFAGSTTLTMLYLPSWMNLVGYVAGMATAFIYHYTQVEGCKLNQSKWFNLLFHAAITLGSCVVFVGAVFLRDAPPPRWAAGLYAALDRTLVAVFFNVFLLGCFSKCKSGIRSMFEWRGFHFLGRVSYCVFLIHFIVLRLSLGGSTQLVHTSIYSMINLLISVTVLSYLLAIPYCLIVELPVLQLWKACVEGDRGDKRPQETPATQPQPTVKPLDLVANIRRRQEV